MFNLAFFLCSFLQPQTSVCCCQAIFYPVPKGKTKVLSYFSHPGRLRTTDRKNLRRDQCQSPAQTKHHGRTFEPCQRFDFRNLPPQCWPNCRWANLSFCLAQNLTEEIPAAHGTGAGCHLLQSNTPAEEPAGDDGEKGAQSDDSGYR